jgi:hypothetical protein
MKIKLVQVRFNPNVYIYWFMLYLNEKENFLSSSRKIKILATHIHEYSED